MAAPAEAAKRKVPFGFFGVTMIGELTSPGQLPDAKLDQQMALMAELGRGVHEGHVQLRRARARPRASTTGGPWTGSWRPRHGTTSR